MRHPGYVGVIIGGPTPWAMQWASLAMPPMFGSLWSFIPGGLAALLMIARTVLEDKTLQDELDGYEEYAARVRYRLLPGVW